MRNLGRVWIVISISLGVLYGDGVQASVDSAEVVKGNPVTLRIKAIGESVEFPQITYIGDAVVSGISTGSSRNLSMINGSITSEVSTTKVLQFTPEHNMTIPSYTVQIGGKAYQTNPIEIRLTTSNAPSTQGNQLFTLQMRTNKSKVHVGESLMVTVYFALNRGVRLAQEVQYTQPDLSDFLVTTIEGQKTYQQGNYQIQEIGYIVTPQKEGNFTITPAQAKVGLPDRSRRDIFGMTFGTKWYQGRSNSLKVEVLPQTKTSDLIGEFTAQTTLDHQSVEANKPVNMTVTIEGKGNLEGFEFPKYVIDGVTIYSDEAEVKTEVRDGQLYSHYVKRFAFISGRDFHIPKRTFTMYESSKDRLVDLNISGFSVSVTGGVPQTTTPQNAATSMVHTNLSQVPQAKEVVVEKRVAVEKIAWWMLVLAFALGMLMMHLLGMMMPKRKAKPYQESDALSILYGHMGEDTEVEEMVRQLYAKKQGDKSVQIDKKALKEMVERFR